MKRLPLAATWDDPRLLEGCSEGTDRLWCEGSQRPPSWRIIVNLAPMGRNLKQIAKAKITWNHGWVKESSAIFKYTNTSLLQVPHSFATMLQCLQQSNKCLVETLDWATPGRLWEKSNISTACVCSNECDQFVLNKGVFADVSYTGWKSVATLEAFKMLARLRPSPTTSMVQFWGPFTTSHNTARQRRQHCKLEKSSSSSSRTSPEGEIKSQTPLPSCSWARSFLRKSAEKITKKTRIHQNCILEGGCPEY